MGLSFSKMIGGGFVGAARAVAALYGRRVGTRAIAYAAANLPPVLTVSTAKGPLRFWCGSGTAAKLALGFDKYEPESRDWIDSAVRMGEHVWDVGANIGVYALYACLTERVTVTAFEPVAGTFAVLVRNISANGLDTRVTPLCMALSEIDGLVPIYLASTEAGESMHGLSAPETQKGRFEPRGRQTVLTVRGDDAVTRLNIPAPHHIKIDVDGHELRVLKGVENTLASVRTVWIEMTAAAEMSGENARIDAFLTEKGFEQRALPTGRTGRNRMYVNLAKT